MKENNVKKNSPNETRLDHNNKLNYLLCFVVLGCSFKELALKSISHIYNTEYVSSNGEIEESLKCTTGSTKLLKMLNYKSDKYKENKFFMPNTGKITKQRLRNKNGSYYTVISESRKMGDIQKFNCWYVDIDLRTKDGQYIQDIELLNQLRNQLIERIYHLPITPSIIVPTMNGVQVYYTVREDYQHMSIDQWKEIERAICTFYKKYVDKGTDLNVTSPNHLLRLFGSYHKKNTNPIVNNSPMTFHIKPIITVMNKGVMGTKAVSIEDFNLSIEKEENSSDLNRKSSIDEVDFFELINGAEYFGKNGVTWKTVWRVNKVEKEYEKLKRMIPIISYTSKEIKNKLNEYEKQFSSCITNFSEGFSNFVNSSVDGLPLEDLSKKSFSSNNVNNTNSTVVPTAKTVSVPYTQNSVNAQNTRNNILVATTNKPSKTARGNSTLFPAIADKKNTFLSNDVLSRNPVVEAVINDDFSYFANMKNKLHANLKNDNVDISKAYDNLNVLKKYLSIPDFLEMTPGMKHGSKFRSVFYTDTVPSDNLIYKDSHYSYQIWAGGNDGKVVLKSIFDVVMLIKDCSFKEAMYFIERAFSISLCSHCLTTGREPGNPINNITSTITVTVNGKIKKKKINIADYEQHIIDIVHKMDTEFPGQQFSKLLDVVKASFDICRETMSNNFRFTSNMSLFKVKFFLSHKELMKKLGMSHQTAKNHIHFLSTFLFPQLPIFYTNANMNVTINQGGTTLTKQEEDTMIYGIPYACMLAPVVTYEHIKSIYLSLKEATNRNMAWGISLSKMHRILTEKGVFFYAHNSEYTSLEEKKAKASYVISKKVQMKKLDIIEEHPYTKGAFNNIEETHKNNNYGISVVGMNHAPVLPNLILHELNNEKSDASLLIASFKENYSQNVLCNVVDNLNMGYIISAMKDPGSDIHDNIYSLSNKKSYTYIRNIVIQSLNSCLNEDISSGCIKVFLNEEEYERKLTADAFCKAKDIIRYMDNEVNDTVTKIVDFLIPGIRSYVDICLASESNSENTSNLSEKVSAEEIKSAKEFKSFLTEYMKKIHEIVKYWLTIELVNEAVYNCQMNKRNLHQKKNVSSVVNNNANKQAA